MADDSYNREPVEFCAQCLWLGNVKTINIDGRPIPYCPHCGSTHFDKAPIELWEALFEKMYHQGKYLKLHKSWNQIMQAK